MSKKRRIFDIDVDLDAEIGMPPLETKSAIQPDRRGPMATAISETAEAYGERQSAEHAIRAENDALAHEYVELKRQGLVTARIPLDRIDAAKLQRDRVGDRDPDIDELKASIRDIGLSNPIRVEMNSGRYELIQGFRRLTAYRELHAENPEGGFDVIPAVMNARGEGNAVLYRRMVDENLVRRDITFGELAQLARTYARLNPSMKSVDQAVDDLYQSASRQKRGHIRTFVRLLDLADIRHVQALSRNMGQEVLKKLESRDDQPTLLADMLARIPHRGAEEEQAILKAYLDHRDVKAKPAVKPSGKTTFRIQGPTGAAKCTAADGRLELRMTRDFSAVPREKLEQAVSDFLAALDR